MRDEPLDLSALRMDAARRERLAATIVARARLVPEPPRGVLIAVAAWRRPALAAAASVAALSLMALALAAGGGRADARPGRTVVEALEVPEPVAGWIVEERAPERGDLLVAIDEIPSPSDMTGEMIP